MILQAVALNFFLCFGIWAVIAGSASHAGRRIARDLTDPRLSAHEVGLRLMAGAAAARKWAVVLAAVNLAMAAGALLADYL